MKGIVLLAISVAVVWLLSGCAGATATPADGQLDKRAITVNGRDRFYLLYTPAGANSMHDPLPLILVFHGGGGTARGIAREVGRALHSIADREGFYVVYPHAVDRIWDFGIGPVPEALDERINDRAYFAAVLDEVTTTRSVDDKRIFATGISRGGMATYFVACVFPDRFRAIAPVAMPMPVFMQDVCTDAKDMGIAILNGTDDPLVPYDGGYITVGRKKHEEVMSTDATVDFWRARNDCREEPSETMVIDLKKDRMRVLRTSWEACEQNPVMLYRIEGGGHTWPNGSQYLPRFMVGPVTRDIDAATEIWQFFSRFR